jgi:hypothetical protein
MAEFEEEHLLVKAARRAHAEGYRRMDAYTPFPVEGLTEALGHRRTAIPLLALLGGLAGGGGGYFLQWFALAVDYPLNVGGRPFHSWPAFIPITFELTILGAALAAMIGMLVLNRLPQPHHPVFNVPEFVRASRDRFFLCIEADDPRFDLLPTRRFLEMQNPRTIREVEA